ncbi:hypothetical protein [Amycolatopsis taiwanensis]|uniref:SRPBCC family protein n=1 Tax=Amycolatopsis taiwanensis TaxID=342230 RepID=A0A9W6R826_9PSEU|nr:hypothetical protein [Amycolatopsis taiwanensis]GLY70558.1 hypothetical protein Atai01_71770 [Amycolatopsis taiwanensis]
MTETGTSTELLADQFAPHFAAMQTQHLVVDAPVTQAYAALRALDFTDVGGGLVSAAFWARNLPERWKNRHHKMPRHRTRLTFDDLAAGWEWTILGERPGTEIAIGVGGKFWKPVVEWRRIEPENFLAFDEPGYGKIVQSLSARPYGTSRSLLTYDARVVLPDAASRAKFRAYWTVAAPFVKTVQAATLRTIARHAETAGQA